jgi:hypothetical protein
VGRAAGHRDDLRRDQRRHERLLVISDDVGPKHRGERVRRFGPLHGGYTPGVRPSGFPSTFPSGALPSGFPTTFPSGAFPGRGDFTPGSRAGRTPGAERTPGANGGGYGAGQRTGGYGANGYGAGGYGGGGYGGGGRSTQTGGRPGATTPGAATVAAPSTAGKIGGGIVNVLEFACIIVLVAGITAGIVWLVERRGRSAATPDCPAEPEAGDHVDVAD